MNKKQGSSLYIALFVLSVFLSGCAGTVKNMRVVPDDRIVSAPSDGKSVVIFMRPSGVGFAIQSSVFEIKGDTPVLAGILAAKKKVAYKLEPGKHLFMVVGESADFMSAELEANKIYYALVTPRMGWWKARFSLEPINITELKPSQLNEWLEGCEWVEISAASNNWASANMNSIQSKRNEYYSEWIRKGLSDRPKLEQHDGQ